ncbi:MAG TPA: glycosyl hydrolase family 39 [Bryobacteraceae bacterium]|jgi:xylan 1,4-beta-xylosidase|nr:glycosyl hydrolase family 39 [Bryobacteraceae bacterium]
MSSRRLLLLLLLCLPQVRAQEQIVIDTQAKANPFPHFWETMFGSGRAILALRDGYRSDLRAVKAITGFQYVRFHGILDDEVGVYTEDEHGNAVYNFAYVDQIYDGLLKNGVRPVVEISFMPKKLAFNPDALHPFWYKPNVSPPKSWEKWDALMTALGQQLIARYGVTEVARWYFEVWNEPNIDFWNGIPRQGSYFELYSHTARALKRASPQLRVGGPATAAASWIPAFLKYTSVNHVPVDFISSHGYADDTVENLFGTNEAIAEDDRVGRAVAKVHRQIAESAIPNLPLLWTEWNVPGKDQVRDTSYVGPALARTISQCDGLVSALSFWTFSDVFEEGGPIPEPFEGHFGLRAEYGINKPSFYDFALLHRLGNERLANPSENAIVTRRADGTLVAALWNLVDPGQTSRDQRIHLVFKNAVHHEAVAISRVDNEHGNTLAAYRAMGSPHYPSEEQVARLNATTALPLPEQRYLAGNELDVELEPNALVLIEMPGKR